MKGEYYRTHSANYHYLNPIFSPLNLIKNLTIIKQKFKNCKNSPIGQFFAESSHHSNPTEYFAPGLELFSRSKDPSPGKGWFAWQRLHSTWFMKKIVWLLRVLMVMDGSIFNESSFMCCSVTLSKIVWRRVSIGEISVCIYNSVRLANNAIITSIKQSIKDSEI